VAFPDQDRNLTLAPDRFDEPFLVSYATDAWWLLGLGLAAGFVLNGLAQGAFLRSGEEPEKIASGSSSLLEGDS
jgi:hypothetical protein